MLGSVTWDYKADLFHKYLPVLFCFVESVVDTGESVFKILTVLGIHNLEYHSREKRKKSGG